MKTGIANLVTLTIYFPVSSFKAMRIPGARIKRTRLVQTAKYVVAVEVEQVIPLDDPSEPCYESETVDFLREIQEHAEREDVAWLTNKGKLYAAVEAA